MKAESDKRLYKKLSKFSKAYNVEIEVENDAFGTIYLIMTRDKYMARRVVGCFEPELLEDNNNAINCILFAMLLDINKITINNKNES